MKTTITDTIVAPATSLTKQAISIIRLSGSDAYKILNKSLRKPIDVLNTVKLRNFYSAKNELLDQVLLVTFVNPNSFTGEDTIEINCHGGILVTQKIIETLIINGARLALPGEFSQRAFLNEKISLIQAQGINDLVEAKNEKTLSISINNVVGKSSKKLEVIKTKIIDIISKIQTAIDYPEYEETENITTDFISSDTNNLHVMLNESLAVSERVALYSSGIKTAIVGKPNVGKSSLLNALINQDKAIVSDEMGTTRDIVEGHLNFKNFNLDLIDTAGIRETENNIEKQGVEKSMKLIDDAQLILYLLDPSDTNLFEVDKSKTIFILNKVDLYKDQEIKDLTKTFSSLDLVFISAKQSNIENLLNKIEEMYSLGNLKDNDLILTNTDEIANLKIVVNKINTALENIKSGLPIDLINIDLREALEVINQMLGIYDYEEEILNNIFRKYCLGK